MGIAKEAEERTLHGRELEHVPWGRRENSLGPFWACMLIRDGLLEAGIFGQAADLAWTWRYYFGLDGDGH